MTKEEVGATVRSVAIELEAAGTSTPFAGYIVNVMDVYHHICDHHPHVINHMRRYYRSDPYQVMKRWVPQQRAW